MEITDYSGRTQRFRIAWIRTGFGRHRAVLVCNSCGRGAIRLFARYGTYACRQYASGEGHIAELRPNRKS
jgi:hypothetical protein